MKILLVLAAAFSLSAQQFPALEAQTLTDKKLTVPSAWSGKSTLFIVGFTQGSQKGSEAWGKQLNQSFGKDFTYYSAAVIEDAPRLVRGMITGSMKRSMPKEIHEHFLVFVKGQKELKAAAGFDAKSPDDAYLMIVGKSGEVIWRYHGNPGPEKLNEIKAAL